ncbi:MAG: LptE family protein [Gilvibacter sp.]
MKLKNIFILLMMAATLQGCGIYSFTGVSDLPGVTTFQVNYFQNTAAIVEPGIDREFTNKLQDIIQNQTSYELVTSGGDIIYEGEITQYYIAPITATAQNTAAQNRLTIAVNVQFYNTKNDEDDLQQTFSFYFDYAGAAQLTGGQRDTAVEEIFDRITQDIVNATLAKW